ncbi:MAG TPA: MinD/ParA family protein [Candidatus Binatus sp.]|nr:MinD/ParA family protein [Candidatus Binatus sp.]
MSIAVHSFKGGTGKSTITSNLAVSLAMRGWRVGVMDMDLEGPGLHVIFNIDPVQVQATLNDVLMGSADPGQAVIELKGKLGLRTGNLYFTPASTNVSAMLRTLRTGFEIVSFMKALENLQKLLELDYLFIDTHPGIENDTLLATGVCDHLLIVSRIDQQDIFGTNVMVELAKSLEKPAHLIFNMIPRGVREADALKFTKKLGAKLGVDVLGILPFSDDVHGALSKSVFITTFPNHPMSARYHEIGRKIEEFNQQGRDKTGNTEVFDRPHDNRLTTS